MKGAFFASHRKEILNLVQNVEQKEKANHPMERIMGIEEQPEGALVKTTGIHIARGISSALSHAYNGDTTVRYLDGENFVKVSWVR